MLLPFATFFVPFLEELAFGRCQISTTSVRRAATLPQTHVTCTAPHYILLHSYKLANMLYDFV